MLASWGRSVALIHHESSKPSLAESLPASTRKLLRFLGQLEEVVILRNTPRQVRAVELEVDLADSLVAQGLRGCRLAANFESDPKEPGLNIRASRGAQNTFSCLPGDSTPAEFE